VQVTYRGSAEERADLLQLYQQHSGGMARVFDWLMLSRPELDSHRFRDIIEAAIAAGVCVCVGGVPWGVMYGLL
jgi:DnaJ family protein C protein 9